MQNRVKAVGRKEKRKYNLKYRKRKKTMSWKIKRV